MLCRSRYSHTDFRKPGSEDEFYDIDFWVNRKNGKLDVSQVKIHKVPVQERFFFLRAPSTGRAGFPEQHRGAFERVLTDVH
jgi:hypothetical protein